MMVKKKLVIWGATGQSIVLEEFLNIEYDICAVFDNDDNICSPFKNVPIFFYKKGFMEWYSKQNEEICFITAIGGTKGQDREDISNFLLKQKLKSISAIHNKSILAKNIKIGKGVQIMMGACISSKCIIGDYVIINTSASIDHECIIANGCHIAPGAKLAGNIKINEYSFIGTGAIILPNISIGKKCIIGAGSVVTKDVPDYSVIYGNPAKIKGQTNE